VTTVPTMPSVTLRYEWLPVSCATCSRAVALQIQKAAHHQLDAHKWKCPHRGCGAMNSVTMAGALLDVFPGPPPTV
jgi:hypothetical protein